MLKYRSLYILLLGICLSALGINAYGQGYPELKWQKFIGTKGANHEHPSCIRVAPDGNLFLGGITSPPGSPFNPCGDIWIVKVDTLGEKIWERELGGSGCEELRDMVITPDKGLMFVGITNSFLNHPEKGQEEFQGDYFIGKIDKNGEIEWLKTYGGLDVDHAYGIARNEQWPEYLVGGASNSQNFDVNTDLGLSNLWCLKIKESGEKWTSWTLGGSKHDWAFAMDGTKDGKYLFAGYTNSEDIDGTQRRTNGDGWVGKMDRHGVVLWQRIYSGKFEDYFTDVIEDSKGRVVMCGNFESEKNGKQFWFLKVTGDGKKMYEKIFGNNMDEYALAITECADGGYLMTGYSRYTYLANKYIKGGEDFWLIKFDATGNIVWSDTYGGREDERGVDVVEYRPGVYYALGEKVNDFGDIKNGKDFWLLRIEEGGCEQIDIDIYTSLTKNTAYVGKNFKLKALVDDGESYLWDFGDGTTSRLKEPVKKYELPGVYELKLTVFLNENCAKTYSMPDYLMVW